MTDPPSTHDRLRLAPPPSAEDLAHRFEREQRAVSLQRECLLRESLQPFRVGSVPYLNSVPLTRGLEDHVLLAPPSQLARHLREGTLDAALVSVSEVLSCDAYEVLDGIAIASLGEVKSVILAHRGPLERAQEVFCDAASLTSVNLLKVLMAERGWHPRYVTWEEPDLAQLPDYGLLIGDRAIEVNLAPGDHQVWDLGAAWYELTGLPFVYAVWALRRGMEHAPLRRRLREARDFGLDTLDEIIRSGTQFTYEFRRDYLSWHVHFHLGSDEKRGLARFMALLRKHQIAEVVEPRFVF